MLQFAPDDVSSNLFIDFIDTKGGVLTTLKMPVFSGTAVGSIETSTSLAEDIYLLRAYTVSGIKNERFGIKTLYLFNPIIKKTGIDSSKVDYQCKFFSNENSLIAGIDNEIYFRATGNYNSPVSISGEILDEHSKTILSFKDAYSGLGYFHFNPSSGRRYFANVNFPGGQNKRYPLPEVISKGLIISVKENQKEISVEIQYEGKEFEKQKLTLLGVMGNRTAFRHQFDFSNKKYKGKIPTVELPDGVLHIMVLDKNSIIKSVPVLINNSPPAKIAFRKESKEDSAGYADYSITFQDTISGSFSISVTDHEKEIGSTRNNILSELLIGQEGHVTLTGLPIESFYHKETRRLVLNTIHFDEIVIDNLDNDSIENADSNYITINAKLVSAKTKEPVTNGEITILFVSKDSSLAIINPVVMKDGSFSIRNMVFYDTAIFNYKWNGQKASNVTVKLEQEYKLEKIFVPSFRADPSIFRSHDNVVKAENIYKEINDSFGKAKVLPTANVLARNSGTLKEQVNRKYASGLFSATGMARVLDLIHEPPPHNGSNVFDYIQGKFSSLLVTRTGSGQYLLTSTRTSSLTGGSSQIRLFLNESEVTSDVLLGVMLSEIAMIKYFPPGNARLSGIGGAGLLAIYTKRREDMQGSELKFFTNQFVYPGYSPVKDFTTYSQEEKNPVTIYWNPSIIVDAATKKYFFKMKRPDSAKKFHVVIEGFTEEGDIKCFDAIIENN